MADYIQIQDDLLPAEISYTVGSTAQTRFTFPWPFYAAKDLVVTVDGVVQALGTDYTVGNAGVSGGGYIDFTQEVTSGEVRIYRDTSIERISGLNPAGPIKTETLNNEYSRQILIDRDNEDKIARAIKKPRFDSAAMDLPVVAERKNKLLGFADAGQAAVYDRTTTVVTTNLNQMTTVVGVGDGATNDLAAFQTAVDAAIANGTFSIYVPHPPADKWYYVQGVVDNFQLIKNWYVENSAFIDGPNNMLVRQTHYSGDFAVWVPVVTDNVIKVEDGYYAHQMRGGLGIYDPNAGQTSADAAIVVGCQVNLISTKETSDQQQVAYYFSTDGQTGASWSGPHLFATDSAICNNPIPMDGELEGTRFTMWRCNPVNFQQAGFGNKIWLTFGHGRGSTIGGQGVYEVIAGQTKGTNYYLMQLTDDTLKFTRYGDARPSGSTFNDIRHEGRDGFHLTVHGGRFGTDGKLYLMGVLVPTAGGSNNTAKRVVVGICDDPSADIEDMVINLSPSWSVGDMDYVNYWEWDNIEVYPGIWFAELRHNEREGSVTAMEGGYFWGSWNDGRSASGFQDMGLQASRSRATGEMLSPSIWAMAYNDHPGARSNPVVGLGRVGGGMAAGVPMTDDFLLTERGTARPSSANDTILTFISDETDEQMELSGVEPQVRHFRSNGEVIRKLPFEGWEGDYVNSTVDLSTDPELQPGDIIIAEVGGRDQDFWVGGGAQTAWPLGYDITNASPGITAFGAEGAVLLTGADYSINSGTDSLYLLKSATDIDALNMHDTGADGTVTMSTGQSIIDFSASAGLALVKDETELRRQISVGDEEPIDEIKIKPRTATDDIEHLGDQSASDRFALVAWKEDLSHVPTVWQNPITGDIWLFRATRSSVGRENGGSGMKGAVIKADQWPSFADMQFTERQNAWASTGDPGHTYTASNGLYTFKGQYSKSVSLPPGRHGISFSFRPGTVPTGIAAHPIMVIGRYDQFLQLELALDTTLGILSRDLYLLEDAAGARDAGRAMYLSREDACEVVDDGDGTWSVDDDAWITVALEYDTEAGTVTCEGNTVHIQPPYIFGLGDVFLTSGVLTTSEIVFDIHSSARPMKIWPLPDPVMNWERESDEILGPNLLPDPGMLRIIDQDGVPIQQPMALDLPGWQVTDRGGCSVSIEPAINSLDAANRNYGGHAIHFNVDIDDVVKSPASLATGHVDWEVTAKDVESVLAGNYMLSFYAIDQSTEGDVNTALSAGVPLQIFVFHDYGNRGRLGRKYYQIDVRRINRHNRLFKIPLTAPQVEALTGRPVGPGSRFGIRFRVNDGYAAKLEFRYVAFRSSDPASFAQIQGPYDEDKTKKLYQEKRALNTTDAVLSGRAISATVCRFVWDHLGGMIRGPDLRVGGAFAAEVAGTKVTATPTLVDSNEDQMIIDMTGSGWTTGDPAALIGVSPDTRDLAPSGAKHLFDVTGDPIFHDNEIEKIILEASGGSTSTIGTLNDAAILLPSYEKNFDRLIGAGEASYNPDVSLGNAPTALSLLHFSDASGEEDLNPGSGGFNYGTGQPVDGSADVTLQLAGGTATTFATGGTYDFMSNERRTKAGLWFDTVYANSGTIHVHMAEGSSSYLAADARDAAPRWDFLSETDTLWNAVTSKPDPKAAGRPFLKREIDTTIRDLKDAEIWDLLDIFYCLIAHDEQTAFLNWKNPAAFVVTKTNSPTFEAWHGATTDGSTNYLDSNYAPATNAISLTQDSATYFTWLYSLDTSVGNGTVLGASGGGNVTRIRPDDGAGNSNYRVNDATNASTAILVPGSKGYHAVDRTSSSSISAYATSVGGILRKSDFSRTSGGLPTNNVTLGQAASSYAKCNAAFFGAGASLGEAGNRSLARICEDHMIRLGAL